MGAIDDGEGAASEGGVHLAGVVSGIFFAFDDDSWRRRSKAGDEVENSCACFFRISRTVVEGERKVDDGNMDRVGFNDPLSSIGGGGNVGLNTHRVKDDGKAIDPWGVLPACVREQEVESAGWGWALVVVEMGGLKHHDVLGGMAKSVPVLRGFLGRNWRNWGGERCQEGILKEAGCQFGRMRKKKNETRGA